MLGLVPVKKRGILSNGATGAYAPITQFRWDMDRLFDRFLRDAWGESGQATADAGIRIDIRELEDRIVVRAEVPGVNPEDLDLSLTGEILTLSGEKKDDLELEPGARSYSERYVGSFERSVQMPCPVDTETIEATHRNGVVTIELKKAEAVRPKRIRIKS